MTDSKLLQEVFAEMSDLTPEYNSVISLPFNVTPGIFRAMNGDLSEIEEYLDSCVSYDEIDYINFVRRNFIELQNLVTANKRMRFGLQPNATVVPIPEVSGEPLYVIHPSLIVRISEFIKNTLSSVIDDDYMIPGTDGMYLSDVLKNYSIANAVVSSAITTQQMIENKTDTLSLGLRALINNIGCEANYLAETLYIICQVRDSLTGLSKTKYPDDLDAFVANIKDLSDITDRIVGFISIATLHTIDSDSRTLLHDIIDGDIHDGKVLDYDAYFESIEIADIVINDLSIKEYLESEIYGDEDCDEERDDDKVSDNSPVEEPKDDETLLFDMLEEEHNKFFGKKTAKTLEPQIKKIRLNDRLVLNLGDKDDASHLKDKMKYQELLNNFDDDDQDCDESLKLEPYDIFNILQDIVNGK